MKKWCPYVPRFVKCFNQWQNVVHCYPIGWFREHVSRVSLFEGVGGGMAGGGVGAAAANSGEVVIDDIEGRIIVNQLGTGTGKKTLSCIASCISGYRG